MTRSVSILGATGSIGASTLAVIRAHPRRFRVVGLSANGRIDRLADLCAEFRPECAAVGDAGGANTLRSLLQARGVDTRIVCGTEGLVELATMPRADTVIAAIVGAAGLESGLAAARAGKRILLANKESLVMAGAVFMRAVREGGAELLPIDSEHNAIHQALPRGACADLAGAGVRRIILTASGGPFRTTPPERLAHVTPDEACAHPNWVMGRKISVDSATMMNKGLEVIEARWLFDALPEQIEVVIHPQSTVHSLVEYADGSLIAQLGQPDMRTPIAYALAYPERIDSGVERLDLARAGVLEFHPPDPVRFPCLGLAFEALKLGGDAPARLSAANEVAVEAFLAGTIGFTDIARLIEHVMGRARVGSAETLAEVLAADTDARALAHAWLSNRGARATHGDGFPRAGRTPASPLAAGERGR